MKKSGLILAGLILSFCIIGTLSLMSDDGKTLPSAANSDSLKLVANYKQWKPVNKTPVLMASVFAAACAPPTESQKRQINNDIHKDKFITIYVNEPGYAEFTTKKKPHFSEGTVIVKEKLSAFTNSNPELLTVMVKRKPGFDQKNGDWEYLTFDGAASRVTSNGKIQHCQECHENRQSEDYVFRSYLLDKTRDQLK